ncbi:hypothetical protein OG474_09720 [Kribbella sp. NBC_01505]|uniref:hypothetical protein n=1 Tax=Kribbella sp. NBC_01505 TaxID=2903580 RepID=UPI00386C98B4
MSSDDFGQPSDSAGITWSDLKGALVLVKVHEANIAMKTDFGETTAVRADVIVLDDKGEKVDAGTEFLDTLIFPKVLQSQVKNKVGGMVLGRVGQGEAKPKQSPPWKLSPNTEADAKVAREYLAKSTEAPF